MKNHNVPAADSFPGHVHELVYNDVVRWHTEAKLCKSPTKHRGKELNQSKRNDVRGVIDDSAGARTVVGAILYYMYSNSTCFPFKVS